jgi:hypothetical protein
VAACRQERRFCLGWRSGSRQNSPVAGIGHGKESRPEDHLVGPTGKAPMGGRIETTRRDLNSLCTVIGIVSRGVQAGSQVTVCG